MSQIHEFINPSDHIVFDAPDDECAALAALVVGEGRAAAKRVADGESVIGLALLGGDGGFEKRYGGEFVARLSARVTEVVAAAHSFRIPNGERSSLTDWVSYAHGIQVNPEAVS